MRRCLQCMNEYSEEYEDVCPHCGYVHSGTDNGSAALRPGTILQNRYIVGTVLRSRDMDLCYIGWDALFDRKVMIQEYFPRYCASRAGQEEPSIYSSKEELYRQGLELFYRQSRQLIRLYHEEDVVTYYACFYANKTAYAVMEYKKARTLEEYLQGRTLRVREAMSLLSMAVQSVEKVANMGIFHGRLDADCFWMEGNGRLVLKDFGAWRYVSGEPGIVDYGRGGQQTDVSGLARLFCQMVTGKEITQAEKLEGELLRGQVRLKRHVTAALKRALAHQIPTLRQFEEELEGPVRRRLNRREKDGAERPGKGREALGNVHGKKPMSRRMLWACVGGAIFLAAFIAVAIFMVRCAGDGVGGSQAVQMVRVPNVINMDVDKANNLLRSRGLALNRENSEFSDEIEEGRISYQNYKEGTMVENGTVIAVLVSKGKERYQIPNVIGLPSSEAQEYLSQKGFTNVTLVESQEEGDYDKVLSMKVNGTVLKAEADDSGETGRSLPEKFVSLLEQLIGGEKDEEIMAEPDAQIELIICKKETETAAVQVEVPELSGHTEKEARELLEQAGLQMNRTEDNSLEPAGTVLYQKPEAGEMIYQGEYVTVKISLGPERISMPDLRGMELEAAKAELEKQGLVLAGIQEKNSDTEEGQVISQTIAPETKVLKGQEVIVEVSVGPEKETERETKKETQRTPQVSTTAPTPEETPAATTLADTPPETSLAPTTASAQEGIAATETMPSLDGGNDFGNFSQEDNVFAGGEQDRAEDFGNTGSESLQVDLPKDEIIGTDSPDDRVIDRTSEGTGGPGVNE